MRQLDPPSREAITPATWEHWLRWFRLLHDAVTRTKTYSATINPTIVAANTTSEQTFTVNGLVTTDVVTATKPTHTAGLVIGNARTSAVNTIAITFGNLTAAPIDPPSETYLIKAVRL